MGPGRSAAACAKVRGGGASGPGDGCGLAMSCVVGTKLRGEEKEESEVQEQREACLDKLSRFLLDPEQ